MTTHFDEEHEQARLAALWLTSALHELQYTVGPIDWQQQGIAADVTLNGHVVGRLGDLWSRFKDSDGDFVPWLRAQLAKTTK